MYSYLSSNSLNKSEHIYVDSVVEIVESMKWLDIWACEFRLGFSFIELKLGIHAQSLDYLT